MDKKIKLPEIVMLIDAAFLNYVVSDLKSYFEKILNRPLREIDLSLLTTYLALDGITRHSCCLCMIKILLSCCFANRQI